MAKKPREIIIGGVKYVGQYFYIRKDLDKKIKKRRKKRGITKKATINQALEMLFKSEKEVG